MKNFLNKTKSYVVNHKKLSIFILIILIFAGYWWYTKATSTTGETRYITTTASLGTIISSVTGSGQVSASNQVNIQPEVSGTIKAINVNPGDYVSSGKILFTLDDTDALKTIRDAQMNLDNANLSLEKLKLQDSTENLSADLSKAYDDGFNTVSNTFLDLPTIITGLDNLFFKANASGRNYINIYSESVGQPDRDKAISYRDSVTNAYNIARAAYDLNFNTYKNTSRTSSNQEIEALISQTYDTTKLISDAIKTSNNYIDFVNDSMQRYNFDIPSFIATHKATLSSYTSQTNSHLLDLLSIKTSIKTSKDAFQNSDIDIKSSTLSVQQKENALADAKDALSKYNIVAPFSGTIASVPVNLGDNAGSGTILATIITSKKLATIPLNEVDIAKIKLGQKATLTFDAIPDLTITGRVEEIDSIGTVSQGVVNYNVKISFDTNDTRVKPGMSTSAAIITNIKQNILTVPGAAVKSQNGTSYVQTFTTALPKAALGVQGSPSIIPPTNVTVTTGLSSDTLVEITSGLNEGDIVVTKTIAGSTSTTSTPSLLNTVGGNRGGASIGGSLH
ncbi:MAG: efflux RND transporter periplasmic adaptor subunit [bacterium]